MRRLFRWAHQASTNRNFKIALVPIIGVSWYLSYKYLTDSIDRSSLLVRQSLFSLRQNQEMQKLFGGNLDVVGPIDGYQSQAKAKAEISFTVVGDTG